MTKKILKQPMQKVQDDLTEAFAKSSPLPNRKERDPEDRAPRNMIILGSVLMFAAVIVIFAGIRAAQTIVGPFFLACFLAVILTAPLRWLKEKGFSDFVASVIIIAGVLISGLSITWILSGSLNQFLTRIPEYATKFNTTVANIDDFLEPHGLSLLGGPKETKTKPHSPLLSSFFHDDAKEEDQPTEPKQEPKSKQKVDEEMLEPTGIVPPKEDFVETSTNLTSVSLLLDSPEREQTNPPDEDRKEPVLQLVDPLTLEDQTAINTFGVVGYIRWGIGELAKLAAICFIVMILVVFMMYEASRLPSKILGAFGTRGITNEHLQKIVDKIWKYMIIKTGISLAVGALVWLLLIVTGVEYALLWALLAFFLNYIPNIGSIIAAVPGVALALFDHGLGICLVVMVGYLIINQTLGYYIEPIFLGDGLGISPLVVLLSLIFWGWLLGLIGMFLSAPLTIVLKIIFDSFSETRWISILMDK